MGSTRSIVIEDLKRGRVIANTFEVVSKIGEGGCGSVYKAKHLKKPGVVAAVKVLDQPEDVQRFHREGKVLRGTDHPNVVKLFGKGLIDGRPYLAMEFVSGGSVRDLLMKQRKLSPQEAAWLMVQAVRGLRAAGTVHRDLKPENLLVVGNRKVTQVKVGEDSGTGTVIKVADFGLAKSVGGDQSLNLTHSGQVMGTPVYMSPEQCRSSKNVSFKTDVYAVGVMLYEMVNGKLPFDGKNVYDIMNAHCDQEVPWPKRMPQQARDICEKCLHKMPGQRYRSLAALERDLAGMAGVPSEEGGGGGGLMKLVLALVVLVLLAAAAWWFQGHYSEIWREYLPEWAWRS